MTTLPAIVVTGLGAVTPAGRGVADTWEGVLAGKAAAALDPALAEAQTPVTLSCRVPAFDPDAELGRGSKRRLDRYTQLALLAAAEALADAGLTTPADGQAYGDGLDPDLRDRVGLLLGSGIGGAETWDSEYPNYLTKGPSKASPLFIPKMLSNTAAGTIAIRSGARGPNMTVNTACAAGASAIHVARDLLRSGQADVMIAGGVEAGITGLSISAFAQMGALTRNSDPVTASRPFDVDRDGFVMGEGAAILVLETEEHARARGATILARVAGAGASADAHHATAPPEDGGGAILAMQRALADAGVDPSAEGHVNAHGTSTPLNDAAEAEAMAKLFGTPGPPVTSIKGVTGHSLGAAGAIEAVAVVESMRRGQIPPTAVTTEVDPELPAIDLVTSAARPWEPGPTLSNSFGFGGHNGTLVLAPA
jgi:beta-ketoacyl-acyl-carrier-protein synthase II